jgi:integrase
LPHDYWRLLRRLRAVSRAVAAAQAGRTPDGLNSSLDRVRKRGGIKPRLHDLRGTFATQKMMEGVTDQELALILGWANSRIAAIRAHYVDSARVVVAIAERMADKNRGAV